MPETNYRLLIEFIFRQNVGLLLGKQPWPVQGIPFRFGVRITNQADEPFAGATLSSFRFTHNATKLTIETAKQVAISLLNPGQSIELWLDSTVSELQGAQWVSCNLNLSDASRSIETFQRDAGASEIAPYPQPNKWGQIVYIQPKMELLQARTNLLVLALTLVVFLDSLIGIRVIATTLIQWIIAILSGIVALLNNFVK